MNLKFFLILSLTLAAGSSFAFAEEDTPLSKEMKTANKSLRALKKQMDDPGKKQANLALIETSRKAIDAAAKLEPSKTKEVPGAEKPAYLDKFRAQINDLAKALAELEAAVRADKMDDAKRIFEKLGELKKKGHKEFAPDDE